MRLGVNFVSTPPYYINYDFRSTVFLVQTEPTYSWSYLFQVYSFCLRKTR